MIQNSLIWYIIRTVALQQYTCSIYFLLKRWLKVECWILLRNSLTVHGCFNIDNKTPLNIIIRFTFLLFVMQKNMLFDTFLSLFQDSNLKFPQYLNTFEIQISGETLNEPNSPQHKTLTNGMEDTFIIIFMLSCIFFCSIQS